MIAIVAAIREEVTSLRSLNRKTKGMVRITVAGVGKEKVIAATNHLVNADPKPSLVMSMGFSGALTNDLHTGDLVLARKVFLADSESYLETTTRYYNMAEKAINDNTLPYVRRDSLTVPGLVRTLDERERLAQIYSCQAVNMEDYWVCSTASQAGVPFLSVRAVLDRADQELPKYIEEIMWQKERRQGLRIILGSMARPLRVPRLLILARQAKIAQKSLNTFTRSFVAAAISDGACNSA